MHISENHNEILGKILLKTLEPENDCVGDVSEVCKFMKL